MRVLTSLAAVLLLAACGTPRPRPMMSVTAPVPEQAPAGKALVVFHAASPAIRDTYLWDGTRLIGQLWGPAVYAYACDPGPHQFLGRGGADSVVIADLAADKVYDIVADYTMTYNGWAMVEAVKLVPLLKADPRYAEVLARSKAGSNLVLDPAKQVETEQWAATERAKTQKVLDKFIIGHLQDRALRLGANECR
jgi:hypothetical protein